MKNRLKLNFFTTLVVILTTSNFIFAQPDSCFQAINLSLCTPITLSNASATATGDDAYVNTNICATTIDRTLWFAFTAPVGGMYEVQLNTTVCTGVGNLEAGVLTGSCGGPFASVVCQSGTVPATLVFAAASAQSFFIVVDGDALDSCSFSIQVCQNCNASFTPSVTSGAYPLSVSFTNTSTGTINYNWSLGFVGGTTTDSDPTIIYDNPGTYMVILTASNSLCSNTDTAFITVSGASALTIANVFSPNNDGVNDFWKPDGRGLLSLSAWVYNRWGEIVHFWEGINGGWDGHTTPAGQPVSEGVYFYKIIAVGYDGQNFEENGTVTVFR